MKLTIIGGSGFIGSHLCSLLSRLDKDFLIYDLNDSPLYNHKVVKGDINDISLLRKSIDDNSTIINLAAEHQDNVLPKSLYYSTNVDGAISLCKIAREKNVKKIIYTSSVAVYGFSKKNVYEDAEIKPFNDYGISKFESELIYKAWQSEDPVNRTLVIIRPTVVFGENNRGNVYKLFSQICSRKFIMIGNGHNVKSLAYVGNLVHFINFMIDANLGTHIFNYVDKPDYSLNNLIKEIYSAFGFFYNDKIKIPYCIGLLFGYGFDLINFIFKQNFPLTSIRVKKFCADSVYESSALYSGFKPPFPLVLAIKKTIKHEFPNSVENLPNKVI